jgi:hypothetical protein
MEKQIAKTKIAEALRNYAQQNGNSGEPALCKDSFVEKVADVAATAVANKTEGKKNNGVSASDLANFKIDPPYGVR